MTTKIFLRRGIDTDYPFVGRVDYADLAVDQSTGTYMIRGLFPNPDFRIVPGLFVNIRVAVGQIENALLVPEYAAGNDQQGRFVMVVNAENEVERRSVTVGPKIEQMLVIIDGIKPDDRIVIEGLQRAIPGSTVEPQLKEMTALSTPEQVTSSGTQPEAPEEIVTPAIDKPDE